MKSSIEHPYLFRIEMTSGPGLKHRLLGKEAGVVSKFRCVKL